MKYLVLLLTINLSIVTYGFQFAEHQDALRVSCTPGDSSSPCQALCQADHCQVATLTCESCARATDMSMVAILKRFHRIYELNGRYQLEQLLHWSIRSRVIAIGPNSPLNIFADPFSPEDVQVLSKSFNRVCGSEGNHYVLAEQGHNLIPQGVICQNGTEWHIYGLKYRDDYYSPFPQQYSQQPRP